jgi:hypothetical protein
MQVPISQQQPGVRCSDPFPPGPNCSSEHGACLSKSRLSLQLLGGGAITHGGGGLELHCQWSVVHVRSREALWRLAVAPERLYSMPVVGGTEQRHQTPKKKSEPFGFHFCNSQRIQK